MNTEITDTRNDKRIGRVFYDSACALCRRWAARFRQLLARNGYALVPLQSAEARRALKVAEAERLAEMRVITPDGDVLGGADAILHLAKAVRWGWPLFALGCLPGMKSLFRAAYRHVARNRHCDSGTCRARPAAASVPDWTAWSPLALATALALVFGRRLPPWAFMWLLAFAMFAGCKWLTFRTGAARRPKTDAARAAGYLFAWPGMDADAFLSTKAAVARPPVVEWWFALGKTLFGSVLVWAFARWFVGEPLLAGWTGMVGLMFVLHFGLFHLLSLAWRLAGVNAPPMMRAPVLSKSPAEFWGARWNTGFHHLSNAFLFRPLHRRVGVGAAVLIVFFISGLIHDLVITVPARGGYGLPTLYFVVQGAGVLFARSRLARRGGVGTGRGWLFTLALTAGPAFWLFPPPFVLNVMIPFLKTIGAL